VIWLYVLIRFISITSLLAGIVLFEGLHLRLWAEDKQLNLGVLAISAILVALGLAGLSVVRIW